MFLKASHKYGPGPGAPGAEIEFELWGRNPSEPEIRCQSVRPFTIPWCYLHLSQWISANCAHGFTFHGKRSVAFDDTTDAMMCYLAFA